MLTPNHLSGGTGCHTGKSFSEALILESVNPQYDERLLIKFPKKYNCVQILSLMG